MRGIKFRAWIKEDKPFMAEVREIDFKKQLFYVNHRKIELTSYFTFKGHIFMEYTGLKDKKGKGKEI